MKPLSFKWHDLARWTSVAAAVLAALGTTVAVAVEFPGPILVEVHSEVTCALAVTSAEPFKEQLILGTGNGFLKLARSSYTETLFTVYANFPIGGRIEILADWEGLAPGESGIVVGAANPDRILFVRFTHNLPYFEVVDSVDVAEDPGSLVFLGSPGEARDELAVSLPGIDQIVVLRRTGNDWDLAQTLDAGDEPATLVALQLDEDPELEFLCANRGPLSHSLGSYDRLLDGDYILTSSKYLEIAPRQVQLYDWNQDGTQELVVAAGDSALVQVLSVGADTIVEVDRIPTEFVPDLLLLAPLPASGHGLFVSSSDREIVDFFRRRDGITGQARAYYPGCRPVELLTCDFNGDGIGDLVSLGGSSENFTVMYGKPDQDFWGFPAIALSSNPGPPVLSDFDGDGTLDLLVPGLVARSLDLYPGLPGGGWNLLAQGQELSFFPGSAAALQIDGDPASELAVYAAFTSSIRLMEYSQTAGFEIVSSFPLAGAISGLIAADLDDDSLVDLVGYSRGNGSISAYFGLGGNEFSASVDWTLGDELADVLLVDLNGDRFLDIVQCDGFSGFAYALNVGGRNLAAPVFGYAGLGASMLASGDLDGDGDEDVAIGNAEEGSLTLLENNGLGALLRRGGNVTVPVLPEGIVCADLDGNGFEDVVVNLREGGTIGALLFSASWSTSPLFQFPGYGDVARLMVGDFNADLANDLLVLNAESQIGFVMPNTRLVFLGVDPLALEVDCQDGGAFVRIRPDRSGPWILEFERGSTRVPLAADGGALAGTMDYENGTWTLALEPGDLSAAAGSEPGRLLLSLGEGEARESLSVEFSAECLEASRPRASRGLVWARQPWPNPFNPVLQARVRLAADGPLDADVFDVAGRRVKTLARGRRLAGEHTLSWNGETESGPAPAGVYLLSIRSADVQLSRKILLVK